MRWSGFVLLCCSVPVYIAGRLLDRPKWCIAAYVMLPLSNVVTAVVA